LVGQWDVGAYEEWAFLIILVELSSLDMYILTCLVSGNTRRVLLIVADFLGSLPNDEMSKSARVIPSTSSFLMSERIARPPPPLSISQIAKYHLHI